MSPLEPIFVFGAGGHGRSVSEVIRREGRYRIAVVLDDDKQGRPTLLGAPWVGGQEKLATLTQDGITSGFVAIGNNTDREIVTNFVESAGLTLVTTIDPASVVAGDARIGAGTVLMPFTLVGAGSRIGRVAILNTSATVDHDCSVGDFTHIAVGAHLTGGCDVGSRSFVGSGAVLGRPVTIGERAVIGAGAAVIRNVPDGVVVGGVPAHEISSAH
jgi:sugar O-acyltransferase (sialic acid O-acetyltransferase NeuD family)